MNHIEPSPQIHALKTWTWEPQLDALYSCFGSKDSVLITIDPDPDAIGSALALKRLLWHKVASVSIGIIRQIRRLNNLTMARLLRLPLVLLESADTIKADKFVLVDAQPSHNDFFSRFHYTAVIDHHPQNRSIEAAFSDVRPDYGATSTIMTQYLRAAGVQPSQTIATALLYGIKTDTRNFERHTLVEDIDAFRYLFEFADHNILRKIEISDLSLSDTKFFHKAFSRKHVVKDRIFAYLDEVPSSDILVEVAEFLLKIHDINWSIVSGVYQGNLIIIVRNDGHRKDAGRLIRRAFGSIGCAGGHDAMARAEVPLSRLLAIIGDLSSTSIERFVRRRLSPFKKY
ncbi:MAG: DHH family phosphoesterase [Deltaproteobacteria bacterium]|jgi:nanoRNase/pAp phosphatase (c-di-AMP/oligoRNAs hydrolase)|nr:DHH family phosphoesterase [Deltaproteobacteria bacterium]MDA8308421.1 DHH family phosphoesterase [Deltaproteobacteria bacterium]